MMLAAVVSFIAVVKCGVGPTLSVVGRLHSDQQHQCLRLQGGHQNGCACGEIGDVTDRWLFDTVDMDRVACFNTEQGHGVVEALRAHCERDDPSKWLESSDDDQVLMCIAFKEHVNIKALTLRGRGATAARVVRAFVNRAIDNFEEAEEAEADCEWAVTDDNELEELRVTDARRFTNVRELTIFVESSVGGDRTCVSWLGLKGEATRVPLKSVVQDTQYELRPSDISLPGATHGPRHTTGF
eukprot:CAMPEP_0196722370 /NCGR_PEP_ID=MMETSP1091-20130531/4743_1 /TAXON_ID=302021 /ORGANISM="Rhodomonas sp., Strain CCMP768" /LENGTH=240 /DNA_ID=CAMNT_0042064051 /DNA_START=187 /DNA_END=909 /DNA_ORIENTATION=-